MRYAKFDSGLTGDSTALSDFSHMLYGVNSNIIPTVPNYTYSPSLPTIIYIYNLIVLHGLVEQTFQ